MCNLEGYVRHKYWDNMLRVDNNPIGTSEKVVWHVGATNCGDLWTSYPWRPQLGLLWWGYICRKVDLNPTKMYIESVAQTANLVKGTTYLSQSRIVNRVRILIVQCVLSSELFHWLLKMLKRCIINHEHKMYGHVLSLWECLCDFQGMAP